MEIKITQEYLQQRPLSYSSLKIFARSPKHYMHYISTPKPEPSAAMALGSAVDCLIFTEREFDSNFLVMPEIDRRTKDGKAKYEELLKSCGARLLISNADYDRAMEIKRQVQGNEHAAAILKQINEPQKEVRFVDEETGLPLIARLDGCGDKIIAELKTTRNAEPHSFAKDAFNLDYPLQCGMYTLAEPKKPFFYIAVETDEPYGISVLKAPQDYVDYGRHKLRKLLNEFAYCMANNLFDKGYDYGYTRGYDYINLPAWAKKPETTNTIID